MTQAFPLQWPIGRPRTNNPVKSSFNKKVTKPGKNYSEPQILSVADATNRLQREIDLLRAQNYVLSTNIELRLDGRPRSNQAEPSDSGVSLYFTLSGKPHCLPCDRYNRVADNIAAIAKHIEATRAIERYGVANMAEMFTGFLSIAPPAGWWDILGIDRNSSVAVIRAAYRERAKKLHSDEAGDAAMAELNVARDDGVRERSAYE